MNVAELLTRLEGRFVIGESTDHARSVTGEPYVVIGVQADEPIPKIIGTVEEGRKRELSFDEETACWSALAAFEEYALERKGVLYWRTKPDLRWNEGLCTVYMRCLISDKPAISAAAA